MAYGNQGQVGGFPNLPNVVEGYMGDLDGGVMTPDAARAALSCIKYVAYFFLAVSIVGAVTGVIGLKGGLSGHSVSVWSTATGAISLNPLTIILGACGLAGKVSATVVSGVLLGTSLVAASAWGVTTRVISRTERIVDAQVQG